MTSELTSVPPGRAEILAQAAAMVDALGRPLGADRSGPTPDGNALRDLASDEVGLAHEPMVFRLNADAFTGQGLPVPVSYQEATRGRALYWLCAPVSLFPARNWGFNELDVRLEFNSGAAAGVARPVALGVLPDAQVETRADIGGSVEVSLDPELHFSAKTPKVDLRPAGVPLAMGAGVDVKAVANAHAALGPFRYQATRAVVTHTPVGMDYVRWRIEKAASLQGEGPSLVVLLAVPTGTDTVLIDAQMAARRYFNFASASLLEKISALPGRLREFFLHDGAPVQDATVWNITSML
ncbi:MAG: hypothetical protein ACLPKE_22380 [Streptosporangiaceae bacterium]